MTRRYAAPAAFLLAVTIAVLAIHYGLQRGPAAKAPVTATAAATPPPKKRKPATTRYYVVQRGDSFSAIAARAHVSVAAIERLNPGVSSTALRVGQRIRVK